jgi:hypothetical protein
VVESLHPSRRVDQLNVEEMEVNRVRIDADMGDLPDLRTVRLCRNWCCWIAALEYSVGGAML